MLRFDAAKLFNFLGWEDFRGQGWAWHTTSLGSLLRAAFPDLADLRWIVISMPMIILVVKGFLFVTHGRRVFWATSASDFRRHHCFIMPIRSILAAKRLLCLLLLTPWFRFTFWAATSTAPRPHSSLNYSNLFHSVLESILAIWVKSLMLFLLLTSMIYNSSGSSILGAFPDSCLESGRIIIRCGLSFEIVVL